MTPPRGARDAGLNLAAAFSKCGHPRVEPVDLKLTGETVAAICIECFAEVPLSWLYVQRCGDEIERARRVVRKLAEEWTP